MIKIKNRMTTILTRDGQDMAKLKNDGLLISKSIRFSLLKYYDSFLGLVIMLRLVEC